MTDHLRQHPGLRKFRQRQIERKAVREALLDFNKTIRRIAATFDEALVDVGKKDAAA